MKMNVPPMEIAKKFHELVGVTELNLYAKLKNHTKRKHGPVLNNLDPIKPEDVENGVVDVSFKEYSQKLLRTAMTNEEMFTSKKISHNQVIAAQRANIEEAKVKNQENALKLTMIKFLRGEGIDDAGRKLIESNTE